MKDQSPQTKYPHEVILEVLYDHPCWLGFATALILWISFGFYCFYKAQQIIYWDAPSLQPLSQNYYLGEACLIIVFILILLLGAVILLYEQRGEGYSMMNLKALILIIAIILVIIALIVFFFGKSLGIIPIECQSTGGVNYCLYCLPNGQCVVR